MARLFFVFTLLALVTLAVSEKVEKASDHTYYYKPKCPCKCFIGYKTFRAFKQCKKKKFIYRCEVSECKKKYYKGKWCCDKIIPPPKPTATATATPSPSPSKKPLCPCQCKKKYLAEKDCLYKPYCKLLACPKKYHGYYYYHEYKCCYH